MGMPPPDAPFTTQTALRVVHAACDDHGIPHQDAQLMRLGENAMFRLPAANMVIRIARSGRALDKVRKEAAVAQWLEQAGFPAVRLVPDLPQAEVIAGFPVTWWQWLDNTGAEATPRQLGVLLREFHEIPSPPPKEKFDPLYAVPGRLANAHNVPEDARAYLEDQLHELQAEYSRLAFELPVGTIHGDAHRGNIIVTSRGPALCDFEVVAHGPREWDLTPTAVASIRLGVSEGEYQEFSSAYGHDLKAWPGYPVLRQVRELTMTTWLMQNTGQSDAIMAEFLSRVDSMRTGDTARRWHAF